MLVSTVEHPVFDMMITLVSTLSPFILLIMTTVINARDKKREKLAQEEREANKKRHDDEEERFKRLEASIDELSKRVDKISQITDIEKLSAQMTRIIGLNESFLKYNSGLSSLVTSIGRGVLDIDGIDPAVAESINKAIEEQKVIDGAMQVELYKLIY